ncbi:C-factor [Planctomycetes bacterium MalM25]|nr:C-factor [Planctomycetes bacterium MalM25]
MNTVLITGANRGMGRAYVEHYLAQGWRVLAAYRTLKNAESLSEGREALVPLAVDLADEASIVSLGEQLKSHFEDAAIDLVINNAGVSGEQPLGAWTAAEFERQFRVNTIGPALVAQAVAHRLTNGAKLVNVSSGMGSLTENPNITSALDAYAASKAALNLLTRRLAAQLRGVTVVAINPGWVQTEMGGPEAPTDTATAVDRITDTIEKLTPDQSGAFLNDDGSPAAW